jgi:hypothetical protein
MLEPGEIHHRLLTEMLHGAIQANDVERVVVLLVLLQDSRVDPTACDNYAIRMASRRGHVEVVRVLMRDPRVNPAARNCAFRDALEKGQVEVAKVLLEDVARRILRPLRDLRKTGSR